MDQLVVDTSVALKWFMPEAMPPQHAVSSNNTKLDNFRSWCRICCMQSLATSGGKTCASRD